EYWKRSGQIPAFGNWDIVNEFPITQYFENARQAGLIHYSSLSGETDLYAVDHKKPVRKAKRIRDRRYTKSYSGTLLFSCSLQWSTSLLLQLTVGV
ncbi:hypothetical protein RYX36_020526, partial [Vicia faba]